MTIPQGYKLYTGPLTIEIQAKAMSLLIQDYGYSESVFINGKNLLFVVEEHTWYGSNPDAPEEPHKGVTVYEKSDSILPPIGTIVQTFGLAIGAAYLVRMMFGKRQ